MESKAKLFGHPIHQMLVVFPIGILTMSVVFDLLGAFGLWEEGATLAYALIIAGLIAGVVAAPFGTMDWLAIPGQTRAKKVGALHGGGNLVVLGIFAVSAWTRQDSIADPPLAAIVLSCLGVALTLVTAWLGGELIDRLGIGVSPDAHVDARSSLDGPAAPRAMEGETRRQ